MKMPGLNGLETNNNSIILNKMEENAKTILEVVRDLFEGRTEYSHMTGDIELCGKTADDVFRQMKEDERRNK